MARVLRIVSTSTLSLAIAVFTPRPTSGTVCGAVQLILSASEQSARRGSIYGTLTAEISASVTAPRVSKVAVTVRSTSTDCPPTSSGVSTSVLLGG
jgi:hypothetical protein